MERESKRLLSGRVEIDDAYLGGERAGEPGKRGRGSPNKIAFVMAVSTTDDCTPNPGVIRGMAFSSETVRDWANESLSAKTQAVLDGLTAFRALRAEIDSHIAIVTGLGRASAKRPDFPYRLNRRYNLRSILPRLLRAAATTRPWTEKPLKAAELGT